MQADENELIFIDTEEGVHSFNGPARAEVSAGALFVYIDGDGVKAPKNTIENVLIVGAGKWNYCRLNALEKTP